MSSRLARARQRLQQRLAGRGIKLGMLLAALSVAEGAGRAALPESLVQIAVRSGLSVAAGKAAGLIPAHIAHWRQELAEAMLLTKAKSIAILLLAFGLPGRWRWPGSACLPRPAHRKGKWPHRPTKSQPIPRPGRKT